MRRARMLVLIGLAGLLVGCGPAKEGTPSKEDGKDVSPAKVAQEDAAKAPAEDAESEMLLPPDVAPTPEPVPVEPDEAPLTVPDVPPMPAELPQSVGGDPGAVPANPFVPEPEPPKTGTEPMEKPAVAPPEEAKPATGSAEGGRAVNLTAADNGKTVPASVGDLVIVELEANPTTGFEWEPGPAMKDSTLELKSKRFEMLSQRNPEIPPAIGQGGYTTFRYQVTATGKAVISLVYRRPGDEDSVSAKSFEATVEAGRTDSPTVTGKIVFRQPPEVDKISGIVVSIRNTALADGPAPLIGEVELKPPFTLPIQFAVPYDPAKVQPNPMFYSISVRVNTLVDGAEKLYYINDTRHNVLSTADDTKCDVEVKKVR